MEEPRWQIVQSLRSSARDQNLEAPPGHNIGDAEGIDELTHFVEHLVFVADNQGLRYGIGVAGELERTLSPDDVAIGVNSSFVSLGCPDWGPVAISIIGDKPRSDDSDELRGRRRRPVASRYGSDSISCALGSR